MTTNKNKMQRDAEEPAKEQEQEMEMSTDTINFVSHILSFIRGNKDSHNDNIGTAFTTNDLTERKLYEDERTLDVNIQVVIKILVQRGFHVLETVGSNIRIFHNSHGIDSEFGQGYVLHLPAAGAIVRFD